ncbi:hypothetical protein Tco_0486727 [Tanacetum coccineum]
MLASIRSQVPTAVDNYLGTKLDDALLKVLERHTADLIEKYSVLPGPKSVKNQESKRFLRDYHSQKGTRWIMPKALTNKVDLSNPEIHQILRKYMSQLPIGGPPGSRNDVRFCMESILFQYEIDGVKASANSESMYFFYTSAQDGDPHKMSKICLGMISRKLKITVKDKRIQGVSESSTSSQQDQDCIVMPIWKDASYFGDAALRSVADAQIQDEDRLHVENDASEKSPDDSSLKDNGTDVQQVNTTKPEINTGSRELSVQTRRMTTSYSEQGFLSAIYEGKTHQALHTSLFVCFLYQEKPKRVSKALSDPAWVEVIEHCTKVGLQKPENKRGIVIQKQSTTCCSRTYSRRGPIDYDEAFLHLWLRVECNEECSNLMLPIGNLKSTSSYEILDHPDKVNKVVKALMACIKNLELDLLTKGFDAGRFQYLVSSIGMLNP